MPTTSTDWPAAESALSEGERFLRERTTGRTVIVPDGDVDGLAAAALALHALGRIGRSQVEPLHPGKGEHVHSASLQARLVERRPDALLVFDMGSRAGPIVRGLPTLVVDHHQPRGFPPGATVVSAFGHEPVAPTSLLAFVLLSRLVELRDLDWLALLGAVGDLGVSAPLPGFPDLLHAYRRSHLTAAVALLNAPRRAAAHDVAAAFAVLRAARSPADIAAGRVDGVALLERYREEVAGEVARCARTRPQFAGSFALLRMSSGAKVHPLVARRWAQRLAGFVVVAANYGYLPGRVNFAMRSRREENLIERLHGLGVPLDGEIGYGHPRATGGSLPYDDFERLLRAMGFSPESARAAPPPPA